MRIIIYGSEKDYDNCVSCLEDVSQLQYRHIEYEHTSNYDKFVQTLDSTNDVYDLVIVVQDGAEGMEAVMASKRVCPDTPVVWISDDAAFGIQSYRIGCTFFGVRPINKEMMADAIHKYNKERLD